MNTYELTRVLGDGGMGKVYEARRRLPGGESMAVACKIMHSALCTNNHSKELFAREGKTCLQVANNHPNLVTVYDFLEDDAGRYYLIMELVEGCSLQELVDEYGALPAPVARRVCIDTLDALAFLHERGYLHRDLSSCNILLSRTGEVKVSDLGLARCLENGQMRTANFHGKKAYASPEALRCDVLDARADLFSFGVVLYEMLTGELVFGRERELKVDESMIAASLEHFPVDLRDLAKGLLCPEVAQRKPATAKGARDFLVRFKQATDRQELASIVDEVHRRRIEDQKPIFEILKINGGKIEKGPDEAAPHGQRRPATKPQGLAKKERKRSNRALPGNRVLPFAILLALSLVLAYIGYAQYERTANGAHHPGPGLASGMLQNGPGPAQALSGLAQAQPGLALAQPGPAQTQPGPAQALPGPAQALPGPAQANAAARRRQASRPPTRAITPGSLITKLK